MALAVPLPHPTADGGGGVAAADAPTFPAALTTDTDDAEAPIAGDEEGKDGVVDGRFWGHRRRHHHHYGGYGGYGGYNNYGYGNYGHHHGGYLGWREGQKDSSAADAAAVPVGDASTATAASGGQGPATAAGIPMTAPPTAAGPVVAASSSGHPSAENNKDKLTFE